MTPFGVAWSNLQKSAPAAPSGELYSPGDLAEMRAFVNEHADSPDPQMRAVAQQIHDEIAAGMQGAFGPEPYPMPPMHQQPAPAVTEGAGRGPTMFNVPQGSPITNKSPFENAWSALLT